ncbi:MAG: hypothetical protein ACI9EF_000965 [Pseudohongiellaceae bacterium]
MSLTALLVAGSSFRRLLSLRNIIFALVAGLAAGLVVRGLPAPSLAYDVYQVLVSGLVALVVLPLAAGQISADRLGGYEQLQGCRPLSSVSWMAGRLVGCMVAALILALMITSVARKLAASRAVPQVVVGRAHGAPAGHASEWRFDLPSGVSGPFDLTVNTWLPLAGSGRLAVISRRGEEEERLTVRLQVAAAHTLVLSDLSPARGGLYVTLRPLDGLVLGSAEPRLVVGQTTLGEGGLGLSRQTLARLGFALLVVLSFASAFRFETACLAGLLALTGSAPAGLGGLLILLMLVAFAALGTSLVRRQALP